MNTFRGTVKELAGQISANGKVLNQGMLSNLVQLGLAKKVGKGAPAASGKGKTPDILELSDSDAITYARVTASVAVDDSASSAE